MDRRCAENQRAHHRPPRPFIDENEYLSAQQQEAAHEHHDQLCRTRGTDIRELAMSGYSEPMRPGLILPFGLESKYFSEEDAKKYGTWFDVERAKQLLKEAGYRPVWNDKGELVETRDAQGNKVPTVYIKSPSGWTDWESIVRIAVRSMRTSIASSRGAINTTLGSGRK